MALTAASSGLCTLTPTGPLSVVSPIRHDPSHAWNARSGAFVQKQARRLQKTTQRGARSSLHHDDNTRLAIGGKHTKAPSQHVQRQLKVAAPAKEAAPLHSAQKPPSPQVPWSAELPTTAGGVVIFNIAPEEPFCVQVEQTDHYPKPQHRTASQAASRKPKYLLLRVEETSAGFYIKYDDGTEEIKSQATDSPNCKLPEPVGYGKENGEKRSYWLSFDRTHLTVKYGKGFHMVETTLLEYNFYKEDESNPEKIRDYYSTLFGTFTKKVSLLEYKKTFQTTLQTETGPQETSISDAEGAVEFDQLPLTTNPPAFVKSSSEVTLFDLDSGNFTLSANLPGPCQVLYQNVAAGLVDLDWPPGVEKYKLSDAIRHSINTKGCILYNALAAKSALGDEPNEKYLRVTLGASVGQSPGIPYVLELWPAGDKSPIHNHGNAYAIVKVLHGGLTIREFNKLKKVEHGTRLAADTDATPLQEFNVTKGDVTWISPYWYQAHQLDNKTNDFCATIQCYMYGDQDRLNWPYFDYLGAQRLIDEFYPDSDFDFVPMREAVLKEYAEFKGGKAAK